MKGFSSFPSFRKRTFSSRLNVTTGSLMIPLKTLSFSSPCHTHLTPPLHTHTRHLVTVMLPHTNSRTTVVTSKFHTCFRNIGIVWKSPSRHFLSSINVVSHRGVTCYDRSVQLITLHIFPLSLPLHSIVFVSLISPSSSFSPIFPLHEYAHLT